MPPRVSVTCQVCGKAFEIVPSRLKRGGGKYCSRECYGKAQTITQSGENNHSWRGGRRIKVCYHCGKEYKISPSELRRGGGKYCSKECYFDAHKKLDCVCKHCGNTFEIHQSAYYVGGGKYCSKECYNESKPIKIKRICERCGKEFETHQSNIKRGGGKYCSLGCYHSPKKVVVICVICGKSFMSNPSSLKRGRKYCSKECYYKGIKLNWENPEYKSKLIEISKIVQNRPDMIALHKEKGYTRIQSDATKQILSEMRKGENNPYYGKHHPGEVLEKMRGENNGSWKGGITTLYDAIRSCNEYGVWRLMVFKRDGYRDCFSGMRGNIHAHHIKSFCSIIEENNITNLDEARSCAALWDINNGVTMLESTHMAHHAMWGR